MKEEMKYLMLGLVWDPVDLVWTVTPRGVGTPMTIGKVGHKGEAGVWILSPPPHQVLDWGFLPRTRVVVGNQSKSSLSCSRMRDLLEKESSLSCSQMKGMKSTSSQSCWGKGFRKIVYLQETL